MYFDNNCSFGWLSWRYRTCNPANPTAVEEVTNPTTGRTWMDRNRAANRAALF
ncbi:MAG: hypothetical protein IPN29_07165 [Saprospiraceae bacterium]|nr:hypothetical protein [Saprospiraceae bacterium]